MGTLTGVTAERTNWPGQGDGGGGGNDGGYGGGGGGFGAGAPRRGLLSEDERRTSSDEVMKSYAARLGRNPDLAGLSDADLDRQVSVGAAQIAAMTCRWLDVVAEFVVRELWGQQAAKSPAQWLSWKIGMSPTTAREHVRVALRLRELPKTRERFAAGKLSYSKVRAITRLADPAMEELLLAYADSATAAMLEQIVSDTARCRDTARGSDTTRRRRTGVRVCAQQGDVVEVSVRLLPEDAARFSSMLTRLVELDQAADRADGVEDGPSRGERQVRAVVESLEAAVQAGPADTSGQDRHLVVLHAPVEAVAAAIIPPDAAPERASAEADGTGTSGASAEAGGTGSGGAPVEPPPREDRRVMLTRDGHGRTRAMRVATLRRLACTSRVDLAVDRDGSPHDQGRARRAPGAALRRQLLERDRGCRFPRCGSTRRLHAHHIDHWEDGGTTDMENMILLCSFHHTFVHEKGWEIRPHPDTGHHALFPPASEQMTIEDQLVGASAEALRTAIDAWGLALHHESLVPKNYHGQPHDRDLTIEVLFDQIVAANNLDAPDSAPEEA